MKEPLYTTEDLSNYLAISINKIHKICYDYNIRPYKQEQLNNNKILKNFYTEYQKNRIEKILIERAYRKYNEVVFIETVFYIQPSKINDPNFKI